MILDWLEEWFRGILTDGIIGNLTGLFDTVNQKVGEIAGEVGATPQGWNAGIFNMIRSLSETVIIPIAGAILAFVMCYELIQMVTENRVTLNRNAGVSTWYYADEFHLLLKEPQTAAYSAEIWKRFRKWGGVPTGATQNVKDLLSSPEIENILENSDYICMLNQAAGDRKILAERLNISSEQLKYVTNSAPGEGLLFFENVILPFVDHFPKDTELYRIMSTNHESGSIYELDYARKAEFVIQSALRTDNNRLIYENGSRELPKDYRFEAVPDREYGKFLRYEAVPHDPDALRELLRDESRKRELLAPGDFKAHIGKLSDEKVLIEAQRISTAFQALQAPNSPNGTHFMVEVSPYFERIASSREQDRLFAVLPYKSLCLSGMKDRRGVFALISSDEKRDLPLRRPRPSVRSQLKAGQIKAAAPKKAAAKTKEQDLEV